MTEIPQWVRSPILSVHGWLRDGQVRILVDDPRSHTPTLEINLNADGTANLVKNSEPTESVNLVQVLRDICIAQNEIYERQWASDDESEDKSENDLPEYDCGYCHDLGGDYRNDRVTPCPVCFR